MMILIPVLVALVTEDKVDLLRPYAAQPHDFPRAGTGGHSSQVDPLEEWLKHIVFRTSPPSSPTKLEGAATECPASRRALIAPGRFTVYNAGPPNISATGVLGKNLTLYFTLRRRPLRCASRVFCGRRQ